jgi:hypothetical protein
MRRVVVVASLMVVVALTSSGTGWAQTVATSSSAGWLERSVKREVSRVRFSRVRADSAFYVVQQPPQKRNWIRRHPALFGALVGFGGGFLIGYLPGDDAVFDDSDASFNGLVVGGVGALAGAIVGEVTK